MTSVSITTGSSSISSSGQQAQGSDSTIAGLRQKLTALNRDLRDALGESSEAGMQKSKAIQMQIQLTQVKLEQMIRQENEKAKSKQQTATPPTTCVSSLRSHCQVCISITLSIEY